MKQVITIFEDIYNKAPLYITVNSTATHPIWQTEEED